MKEASSSPFFSARAANAGGAAAAAAEGRRPPVRVKSCCSSSSSASSSLNSSNSPSSLCSSHLGSPAIPASPFCSSSAIPFSWEKQPGVPKHSPHGERRQQRGPGRTLPPPPSSLRPSNPNPFPPHRRNKKPELNLLVDPFAVALVECSKERDAVPEDDDDGPVAAPYWKGAGTAAKAAGGRRKTIILDLLGFVDAYTSCKTASSVADSAVCVRRPAGRGAAAYDLLNRRRRS